MPRREQDLRQKGVVPAHVVGAQRNADVEAAEDCLPGQKLRENTEEESRTERGRRAKTSAPFASPRREVEGGEESEDRVLPPNQNGNPENEAQDRVVPARLLLFHRTFDEESDQKKRECVRVDGVVGQVEGEEAPETDPDDGEKRYPGGNHFRRSRSRTSKPRKP